MPVSPLSTPTLRTSNGASTVATWILATLSGVGAATGGILIVSGGRYARITLACAALVLGVVIAVRLAQSARTLAGFALSILLIVLLLVPVDYLSLGKEFVSLRIDPIFICAAVGLIGTMAAQGRVQAWPVVLPVIVVVTGALTLLAFPDTSARYYYFSFIVVGCLVFVTAWRGTRNANDFRCVSRVIMWSGGLAAGFGVSEYVLRRNPVYGRYFPPSALTNGSSGYRITTTIGHPLDVAALLGVVMVISVGIALSAAQPRERFTGLGIAALAFTAMVMTKSRSVIVLAPIAVLAVAFLGSSARRLTGPLLLIALSLAAGAWLTRNIWLSRFVAQSSQPSTEARVLGLHYTESLLSSAIPFGLGFGAAQARAGARGVTIAGASPEDGWAELLIDAGPLFLVALIAIPIAGGVSGVRHGSRKDPLRVSHGIAALFLTADGFAFNAVAVPPRSFIFATMALAGTAIASADQAAEA